MTIISQKKKPTIPHTLKSRREVKQVEELRNELHEMVEDRGKWDKAVIQKSQELDRLMNRLHKKNEDRLEKEEEAR